jgi:hypothetical protein
MRKIIQYCVIVIFIILTISITFFLGMQYAKRDIISSQSSYIQGISENNATKNSLNLIQFKPIYSILDDGNARKTYGQVLIKPDKNTTELLLQLTNIPFTFTVNNKVEPVPTRFYIQFVKVCCNGLDYEKINTPPLVFDTNIVNNFQQVEFSTTVNFNIVNEKVDRIMIFSEKPTNIKIVKDNNKDWPKNLLEQNSPYFWANII